MSAGRTAIDGFRRQATEKILILCGTANHHMIEVEPTQGEHVEGPKAHVFFIKIPSKERMTGRYTLYLFPLIPAIRKKIPS